MDYATLRIYRVLVANEYEIQMVKTGPLQWEVAQKCIAFRGLDSLSRTTETASEFIRAAGSW